MRLVIVSNRPGLIRGGVRHPQAAEYAPGTFTPDQLREMLAEPELTLAVGRLLTQADIDALDGGEAAAAVQVTAPEAAPAKSAKPSKARA